MYVHARHLHVFNFLTMLSLGVTSSLSHPGCEGTSVWNQERNITTQGHCTVSWLTHINWWLTRGCVHTCTYIVRAGFTHRKDTQGTSFHHSMLKLLAHASFLFGKVLHVCTIYDLRYLGGRDFTAMALSVGTDTVDTNDLGKRRVRTWVQCDNDST